MTIASEISRLQTAKSCIKASIEAKGVTVGSNDTLDNYAGYIDNISTGTSIPLTNPTIYGAAEHGKNYICWDDPDDDTYRGYKLTCWQNSKLVRKMGSAPSSVSDGTVLVTNTTRDQYKSSRYTDSGLTNGCSYYYKIFSESCIGEGSSSSALCLKPTAGATIDIMLIGGGGGGGGSYCGCRGYSGGGGGGGQVKICSGVSIGQTTSVTIGAGGTGCYSGCSTNGGNTSVGTIVAYGGGAGGGTESDGCSGGNGGGGGGTYGGNCSGGTGCNYNGGRSCGNGPGGGGGAGAVGGNSPGTGMGGNGGAGCTTTFTGKSETFAGGGGGGSCYYDPGSGGSGGGGSGGCCTYGGDATFYGGGGGGAGYSCKKTGGDGYQGLVVIKYPTSCGYTITGGQCCYTCNGYKYHCFTSSGTITVS